VAAIGFMSAYCPWATRDSGCGSYEDRLLSDVSMMFAIIGAIVVLFIWDRLPVIIVALGPRSRCTLPASSIWARRWQASGIRR
jgi:hypothetical protein